MFHQEVFIELAETLFSNTSTKYSQTVGMCRHVEAMHRLLTRLATLYARGDNYVSVNRLRRPSKLGQSSAADSAKRNVVLDECKNSERVSYKQVLKPRARYNHN
jgi:hypothetical protein